VAIPLFADLPNKKERLNSALFAFAFHAGKLEKTPVFACQT